MKHVSQWPVPQRAHRFRPYGKSSFFAADLAPPLRSIGRRSFTRSGWLAAIVLIVVPLVVFGRVAYCQLVAWDDNWHLTENPYLNPLSWGQLLRLWSEPYFSEYVPMLYTWFAGEMLISQATSASGSAFDPGVFHIVSLLLHVASGLLVFRLLRRFFQDNLAACFARWSFCSTLWRPKPWRG